MMRYKVSFAKDHFSTSILRDLFLIKKAPYLLTARLAHPPPFEGKQCERSTVKNCFLLLFFIDLFMTSIQYVIS